MRLVGTKSLKPGETLAISVYTSSGKVILNAGVVLTENFVEKLNSLGVDKVYIEDERFNDIEIPPPLDLRIRNNASQILKDTYDNINKGKEINEYVVKDVSKQIVEYVREHKDKGASILSTSAADEYILEHSINVAILAAFIGNKMDYNYNQLCDLVTGAIIHDLGRDNKKEESPEHVQKAFDILRKCRGLSLHSSIVCFEHHENFDGSGYPRKLKGTGVSEFSRIVRVADVYDNALHGFDINTKNVMPHQAYEVLLALSGKVLDPKVVEAFRDTVVFYPNGCTVTLSNNLEGVVIKQNIGSPQRPVVRVLSNNKVMGEIDLLKSLTLSIKDVVVI